MRQETERPVDPSDRERGPARRGWLLRPPTLAGAAVALLFWWWSLDPSMLPRSWYAQGAVSGLSAAIGYLLGTLIGAGVRWGVRRLGREPTPGARRRAWLALGVAGAVVVVAGLALWPGWQNQQRDLVGMERVSASVLGPMVAVTLVLFGLLFLIGRLVGHGVVLVDRLLARRLPRLLAHGITAAVLVVAAVVLTRDVVVDGFLDWADKRFGQSDTTTPPGVVAPTTPTASGSPASLVPWAPRSASTAAASWPGPRPGRTCGPSTAQGPRSWSRSGSTPGCGRPARPTSGPRSRSGSWSGPAPSGARSWGW